MKIAELKSFLRLGHSLTIEKSRLENLVKAAKTHRLPTSSTEDGVRGFCCNILQRLSDYLIRVKRVLARRKNYMWVQEQAGGLAYRVDVWPNSKSSATPLQETPPANKTANRRWLRRETV